MMNDNNEIRDYLAEANAIADGTRNSPPMLPQREHLQAMKRRIDELESFLWADEDSND